MNKRRKIKREEKKDTRRVEEKKADKKEVIIELRNVYRHQNEMCFRFFHILRDIFTPIISHSLASL